MYKLDPDYIPENWHDIFDLQEVIKNAPQVVMEEWPGYFRERIIEDIHWKKLEIPEIGSPAMGSLLDLRMAYHLFNKSAIMYSVAGGFPDSLMTFKEARARFSVDRREVIEDMWDLWLSRSTYQERSDSRFVLAPLALSVDWSRRVGEWCGMHGEPLAPQDFWSRYQQEEDLDLLIQRHVLLCDKLQERATTTDQFTKKEVLFLHDAPEFGSKMRHSYLAPTCRAIFAIARYGFTEERSVVLVLTGHNEDLKSGPPTFDDIDPADIVCRRTSRMIEVTAQSAVRYLHDLERREEAANKIFREMNVRRRRSFQNDLMQDFRRQVELSKEGGRVQQHGMLRWAWKDFVLSQKKRRSRL